MPTLKAPFEDSDDVNRGSGESMTNIETPECNAAALTVTNE